MSGHSPFVKRLGLRSLLVSDGQSQWELPEQDEHLNTWRVVHGGVLMSSLDVAMGSAARSACSNSPGVVTIEMKTSFMRPAKGPLQIEGQLLHRTATLAFCQAQVKDAQGRVCAMASGTFKYLRALPQGKQRHEFQEDAP